MTDDEVREFIRLYEEEFDESPSFDEAKQMIDILITLLLALIEDDPKERS